MTPKEKFIQGPHKVGFDKIATTPEFDAACDYALLQLQDQMPIVVTDPSKGWDSHSQMVGARRVLEILKNLHLPEQLPEPVETQTPYRNLKR